MRSDAGLEFPFTIKAKEGYVSMVTGANSSRLQAEWACYFTFSQWCQRDKFQEDGKLMFSINLVLNAGGGSLLLHLQPVVPKRQVPR